MSKARWKILSAVAVVIACVAQAEAEDISAKKLAIKDNANPAKRQVQIQSADAGVLLIEADDPGANGASIHVYSATDDFCAVLPSGPEWSTNGKLWKYKNKLTKNSAQIGDGKLKVKIKSNVDYSLADDGTQGIVNVQVQFGDLGTRYCMRCSGNKKDDAGKFIASNCVAAICDAEPSICDPNTTTTTTSTTSTSTTTVPQVPGVVLQGVLPSTNGRFNYNLVIGVPGADAACNTNFPGSHACELTELQAAEAAGDLVGRKDLNNVTVTSFWAIDPARPDDDQCTVSTPWDYLTAHTGQFADRTSLNNPAGTLSAISSGVNCGTMSWVGCCF
jgi:hypothetical protein